jgi:signal transduction histidine kinase
MSENFDIIKGLEILKEIGSSIKFGPGMREQFVQALEETKERINLFERQVIEKNDALKKALEEIEKQRLKIIEMEKYQEFTLAAASINHEINNPLTTIIGNLDLILMTRSDLDPLLKKKLAVILAESRRIAEITKKLRILKKTVTKSCLRTVGEEMIDTDSSIQS